MLTIENSISVAETAYMADVTDRDINRLVDEDILPRALIIRVAGRRLAPLSAPFATFYFRTSEDLTKSARIRVISTIIERLAKRSDFDQFLTLSERLKDVDFDWKVSEQSWSVVLSPFVDAAYKRSLRSSEATSHVVEDPDVMGGLPCFAGTRVPVANILAARDDGMTVAELKYAYPFLTERLIEDAEIYLKSHPRPGRPRRLSEAHPDLRLTAEASSESPRGHNS